MASYEDLTGYDPAKDADYMSADMRAYFKEILSHMRQQILEKEREISLSLVDEPTYMADDVEKGTLEELHYNEFMFQEHEFQQRCEVEAALKRIDDGSYGYCLETDEPIGVKRLLAAPYTRYSIKIQRAKEEAKKRVGGLSCL